jgi:putative SOS response-associated peptidase YedK
MCGRYTFFDTEELLSQYDFNSKQNKQIALKIPDNYNVAPGAHMPVIVRNKQQNSLEFMVWGLVPSWSKTLETGMKLINARQENLLEKRMWKALVKSKRCIVPARGFYEWKTENGSKLPYYIEPKKGNVFNFAGLWDKWQDSEGVELLSFTIITTKPNNEMKKIHTRMPAILDQKKTELWLSPISLYRDQLDYILGPAADDSLNIFRVTTEVNDAHHNKKQLIYPLDN